MTGEITKVSDTIYAAFVYNCTSFGSQITILFHIFDIYYKTIKINNINSF